MNKKIPYKIISIVVLIMVAIGVTSTTSAATLPSPVTETQVLNRINILVSKLNNKFFTIDKNDCGNDSCNKCKNEYVIKQDWLNELLSIKGVSVNCLPAHWTPQDGRFQNGNGWSCYAFATFAQWYIFKENNTDVVLDTCIIDKVEFNYENILKYGAKPGDVIRIQKKDKSNFGHSMIFISSSTQEVTCLDSNYIDWPTTHNKISQHTRGFNSNYYMSISRATNYNTKNLTITSLPSGTYSIRTLTDTNKALDINPGVTDSYIWDANSNDTQKWNIEPVGNYYKIINAQTGLALDVKGGTSASGIQVQQYKYNGTHAQLWQFFDAGNGNYYIRSALGYYLDLYGADTTNGNKIYVYDLNAEGGRSNQTWQLRPLSVNSSDSSFNVSRTPITVPEGKYRIVCALGNERAAIEISNGSKQKKGNAQLWQIHDGACQQWYLQKDGDYYKIKNVNSGLFLDVDDGKAQNGRNVWQWTKNKTNAQKWILEDAGNDYVYIKTALGDYYLDAQNAKSDNGTNIQIYQFNPAYDAQKFKLVRLDAPSYYFDVNGTLDGTYTGGINGFGTVDVYIDGVLVANDVSDYYTKHPEGTRYEIKDIKALDGHSYDGLASGSLSGTIVGGDTSVNLRFSTKAHTHTYSETRYEDAHPHKGYQICSCGSVKFTGSSIYNSSCSQCLPEAASSCTLYYDANGGIEPPSPKTVSEGERISISLAEPSKNGYVFNGWSYNRDSNKADLLGGDRITLNSNTTIYAVWTKKAVKSIVLTIGSTAATVSGKTVYNDVAPLVVADRTMLPARFVAENLGAVVSWNGDNESVTIEGNNRYIELFVGSNLAKIDGETITLDSTPFIQNGRTYVPVRFISEALGANVEWVEALQQVIITA